MRRLITAAVAFAVVLGGSAEAASLRKLRFARQGIIPPIALNFGVKTLACHGGYPTGQPPGTAITGTGAADFGSAVDSAGNITPSGTCNTAKTWSKSAGETYNLNVGSISYSVTLVANAAHVTATAADTSTSNQLRTLLNSASFVALGDTIYLRDGSFWNPTGALWRIRPPAGGYSGSGRITIRSDTPDSSVDANGNFVRGGLAKVGAMAWDSASSGDVLFPIDFRYVTFYGATDATRSSFLGYATSSGFGVSCYYCRFENAATVSLSHANIDAFQNRQATLDHSYVKRTGRGVTGTSTTSGPSYVTWNIFDGLSVDAMTLGGENWTVTDNFAFNFQFLTGAHPDCIQHLGATTVSLSGFDVERNICYRNVGPTTGDAQGIFQSDTISPYWMFNGVYKNNVLFLTAAQGLTLTRFDGALVKYNYVLDAINDPYGTGSEPTLQMALQGSTSINSTYDRNVAIGKALAANTDIDTVLLPMTLSAYTAALPSYVGGSNPGVVTRAIALARSTPANLAVASGGFKQTDGTFSGALFPACSGQANGAWNDGTVWNCADSTWLAAHPAAQ